MVRGREGRREGWMRGGGNKGRMKATKDGRSDEEEWKNTKSYVNVSLYVCVYVHTHVRACVPLLRC